MSLVKQFSISKLIKGGLISSQMLLTYPESKISGVILEAAAFEIHPDSGPWYIILGAKILNFFVPNMKGTIC